MISDDQMDTSEMESQSQRYEQELEIICDFGQLREDLQDLHEDEEPVKFDELAAQVRLYSIFYKESLIFTHFLGSRNWKSNRANSSPETSSCEPP